MIKYHHAAVKKDKFYIYFNRESCFKNWGQKVKILEAWIHLCKLKTHQKHHVIHENM